MIAILHNIRSIHNTGSIFRSADAVGIKKLYLCGITPAPVDAYGRYRQKFTKVSLGAERFVDWEKIKFITPAIKSLKNQGYKIFVVEQSKNSIPYFKFKLGGCRLSKLALVLGNEVDGLPKNVLKQADKILEIPMRGRKKSLNVAAAFSIVSFYLRYQ